jgi:MarR family transcriptional regulator, lower aerobic nicotinate degradation pathway regulator
MKKEEASVIPLIEKWETFNQLHKGKNMYDFAAWLLSEKQNRKTALAKNKETETRGKTTEVAILVTRLYRYLGISVGPQLKKLGFTKEHEYNFLYQVSRMDRPNKNDLSKENMMELSTGRDIIRRLKIKRLVEEKEDPNDRRAMLISLTSKGKKLLTKSFSMMAESFKDFLGDLTTTEQEELVWLLTKLNHYHVVKNKKAILTYL